MYHAWQRCSVQPYKAEWSYSASVPIPDIPPFHGLDGLVYTYSGAYDPATLPLLMDLGSSLETGLLIDIKAKPRSIRTVRGRRISAFSGDGREFMILSWVMEGGKPLTWGQCADALDHVVNTWPQGDEYKHPADLTISIDNQPKIILSFDGRPPGEAISFHEPDELYFSGDFFSDRPLSKASVEGVLKSAKAYFSAPERADKSVPPETEFYATRGPARFGLAVILEEESRYPQFTYADLADMVEQLRLWYITRGAWGVSVGFWGPVRSLSSDGDTGIMGIDEAFKDSPGGMTGNSTFRTHNNTMFT